MDILDKLQSEQILALKSKNKDRLRTIRLILSEIKKVKIDSKLDISEQDIFDIFAKMLKQRQESINQYKTAGRDDLVLIEEFESNVIKEFLPDPLTDTEITNIISEAIVKLQPSGIRDMGKVIAYIKPKLIGRADMAIVSNQVKNKLA